jgi:hypothetical protein
VVRILGILSLANGTAPRGFMRLVPPPWKWEYRNIALSPLSGTLSPSPAEPPSLRRVDPLIRELVQYRDLINNRTEEVEEHSCWRR